jgi:hypothetical protein
MMTPKRTPKAKTPLERMTDLTRRLVAIPKTEIAKRKPASRKRKKA